MDGRRALGAHGERLVARWYEQHGYVVLARNWRRPAGELDLVVGRPGLVVVCEVKARSSEAYGTPGEAVTRAKQLRLRRLAAQWLAEARPGAVDVRFDVACVRRGTQVEIIEAAF